MCVYIYVYIRNCIKDNGSAAAVTVTVNNKALHLKSNCTVMCSVFEQDYVDQDFRCVLVHELEQKVSGPLRIELFLKVLIGPGQNQVQVKVSVHSAGPRLQILFW